ncbi:MAG TPA: DUF4136 domain-containing protein [Nitrospira sp.]|nr:DUF4136 domain-containing protein [Nitrospira sp.]
MHIRFLIAWVALGLLAVGGCAGPDDIKVHTDFSPSAEFSAFHTFAFSGMTDRGRKIGASDKSPLRMRVKAMVDKQLAAKGLREVGLEDHPDLLVHVLFGVNEADKYQEATLVVNLAESSEKKLVWRAVISERVGDNLEKNFEMVNKGVTKAFNDYPPAK